MRIIKLSQSNKQPVINNAIKTLKKGGLIIYPTETCYGVGVDATNPEAVQKLLAYKNRPTGKPISIAVTDQKMASDYVQVNKIAENLYKNFLPGPITVISESKGRVADGVIAEDNSLGVRIPDYAFALDLIKAYGKPITATSANLSGRKTPYSIQDILDNASEKNKHLIDLIIDAGTLPKNPPSTVVDTRLNDERVLRKGKYSHPERLMADSGSIQSHRSRISLKSGLKGVRDDRKNIQSYTTKTPEETQDLGKQLMNKQMDRLKDTCIIFALQGDLGAGKTQLAKGVAKALGIEEIVTSPTFTIVKEYIFNTQKLGDKKGSSQKSKIRNHTSKMYHIDTWRMEVNANLDDIGFSDMIASGNVLVIEWVEKLFGELAKVSNENNIVINILFEEEKNKRRISISQ